MMPTDKEVADVLQSVTQSQQLKIKCHEGVLGRAAVLIKQLQAELTDERATVEHLREKAEFDMPDEMKERFHNGQCPDACDMIDGPCACGAWHSAKEWIGKLSKQLTIGYALNPKPMSSD